MRLQSVLESVSIIGNIQPIMTVPTTEGLLGALTFFIVIWVLTSAFCIYHKYATNKAKNSNSRDQSK
ncbi:MULTISPECIES: hypothetical protein [Bacillus cereus group]|uniref:Uncharacterized protein n=1 Tax=Bacillus toyonensis TaxID=155322 RepID=A0A2C4MQX6_9BACI|nr:MULTISPECIES: hypothetical protein [Bacillus cereus group]MCU4967325.1 hypothetical protein [Bacillus toyonensis]PED96661.1 hypothetical protein CON78_28235 [Bacillus toyonensis]PEE25056.1 hypothetical protein CON95_04270 [Bacillus toyonensis]PEJ85571.1 hypothetical protein CN891_19565 [Bacillus toyonensis]PEJ88761.1 hypothetical protein CN688_27295 [Bacillus toyonensis]